MILKSKICGISDSKILYYITNHNYPPQFVGFIVNYPKSNRYVDQEKLQELLKIDKKNPATFSKKIIKSIIRKKLRFTGILISDDISMKALKYDLVTNAKKSIEAGCNLVLYCSGNTNDNFKLIKSVPYIDKFTIKKTSEIRKILR